MGYVLLLMPMLTSLIMQKLKARHENMTISQGMTDIRMQLKYLAMLEPRNRYSIRVIEPKHMPEILSIGCFADCAIWNWTDFGFFPTCKEFRSIDLHVRHNLF